MNKSSYDSKHVEGAPYAFLAAAAFLAAGLAAFG